MALDLTKGVTTKKFSGLSKVQSSDDQGLAAIVRNLLVREGRRVVRERGLAGLTDSSTGVAGIVFTADAAADQITLAAGLASEQFRTGAGPFTLVNTGGALPTGLAAATNFWLRRVSDNVYTLHTSYAGAVRRSVGDDQALFTTNGTGTQRLQAVGQYDALASVDLTGLTTGFTAASWDTSVDSVFTALATLQDRANQWLARLGAGTLDDGPGTSGGATVGAIDKDVATNSSDTTATTYASAQAAVDEMLNGQKTVIDSINVVRRAVGLADVPSADALIGTADLSDGVNGGDAATNGVTTDATTIATSATEAAAEIILTGLADNVALLADMLDEVATQDLEGAVVVETAQAFQADTDVAESFFVTAPVSGRITKLKGAISATITGTTTYTLELNGSAVTGASLGLTGAVGVYAEDAVSGVIAPDTANTNYVQKGDLIEIVSDGTGTGSGAARVWVEITEGDENQPALGQFAA